MRNHQGTAKSSHVWGTKIKDAFALFKYKRIAETWNYRRLFVLWLPWIHGQWQLTISGGEWSILLTWDWTRESVWICRHLFACLFLLTWRSPFPTGLVQSEARIWICSWCNSVSSDFLIKSLQSQQSRPTGQIEPIFSHEVMMTSNFWLPPILLLPVPHSRVHHL